MKRLIFLLPGFLGIFLLSQVWALGGSSLELPGGAVLGIWSCRNGDFTALALENLQSVAGGVHVVIYDSCGEEIMNFTVPLSGNDIWLATLTCDANSLIVQGEPSHYEGPNNGSESLQAPRRGVSFGYLTAAITQLDVDNNGDPRNDPNLRNQNRALPNALVLRTVIGSLSAGNLVGLNGISLVGFYNLGGDDLNGIRVNLNELFSSRVGTPPVPGSQFAVGSANGHYWATYNFSDYQTSFFVVFPGRTCQDTNTLSIFVYNDNQVNISLGQIDLQPVSYISPSSFPYPRGFLRIQVESSVSGQPVPLYGYSIYERPGDWAVFPFILEQKVFCNSVTCITLGL